MSLGADPRAHLRALAHPLRLRILSLLTSGAGMTAAEVARELDVNHANASYHLRQLHATAIIEVAGQERIHGGLAKRYRYDLEADLGQPDVPPQDNDTSGHRVIFAAMATELDRRSAMMRRTMVQHLTDAELWVDPKDVEVGPRQDKRGLGRTSPRGEATPYQENNKGERHDRPVRDGALQVTPPMQSLAPLRFPAFRFLATGRMVTMLGNAVAPIALAFAVLDLTGSARDLGLVVGARSLSTSSSC